MQNVVKYGKYSLAKFANFNYICKTPQKLATFVIILYKNLQTSKGYIFHVFTRFATKLCNFTNLKMLFLTAVIYFKSITRLGRLHRLLADSVINILECIYSLTIPFSSAMMIAVCFSGLEDCEVTTASLEQPSFPRNMEGNQA